MEIKKIGMIGAGSMGGMMSLLFAELGIDVNFYDPSPENSVALLKHAKEAKLEDRVKLQKDYAALCDSLGSPKVFIFSLPHGETGDKTVQSLHPLLTAGDIIMDASNEHYLNTERRQKILGPDGIHYVGMGVSGGYQSARHGPSISPGGDDQGLDLVLPFLQAAAAKDVQGRPCVQKIGPGGSGHYVKMVHNGIEHGMMSALCEVWGIMHRSLDMGYEEIALVFDEWKSDGPLLRNFLVTIGADICRTREPKDGTYVLSEVKDKVVQDVDGTEGTGVWTVEESASLHASTPTLTAAHQFRLTSADSALRGRIKASLGSDDFAKPGKLSLSEPQKQSFINDLHKATYASFLLSFTQGLDLLTKASRSHSWFLDFAAIISIWRGGCIIQSDAIADLLQEAYVRIPDIDNLLCDATVAKELKDCYAGLKNVVLRAIEVDANVPALSASLEYLKYSASTDLPTQFQEAELDYFGRHMFDLKAAGPGKPVTGRHHFEWKSPRGRTEDP